ncbi:MAG: VWA domain-containing protein [Phycisphaeraceae bacterium]|nr:VWA domain-containing protein [Phycisphaeraceae bacterium]
MTWLTPFTGIVLAAITVPLLLALYFLKLRRRRRAAPTTMLWRRAVEDLRANAPFQRLRPSWLLFLQLLVLILVALAVMQPRIDLGAARGGRVVILIDNSASMNTTDGPGGRTRLDEAKRLARERIDKLMSGGLFSGAPSEVMVIAFSDRAEVRSPFSGSREQVLASVDGIEPSDAATRIGEALTLARAFTTQVDPDAVDLPPERPAQLELFSDGRIADLAQHPLRSGETLRYVVIGRPDTVNAGIETIAADRSVQRPEEIEVFAAFRNTGREAVRADAQLLVDGLTRAITPRPVEIPAAQEVGGRLEPGVARLTFRPFEQTRQGTVEVRLVLDDAYAVDNVARLVTNAPKRLRAVLVGDQLSLLQALLEALPLAELRVMTCAQFTTEVDGGRVGPDYADVLILSNCWPEALSHGRILSFGLPKGSAAPAFNAFGEKSAVRIASAQRDHPTLSAVNLDEVVIARMTATAPSREVQILAESIDGPAIAFAQRGTLQAVVVTFDPLDSNWPFQRSFVNFVANAIEWLGALGDAAIGGTLVPGDVITARLPASARDIQLTLPDGRRESPAVAHPTQFAWGPVRRAGVYELSWVQRNERESRRFAVNMLDADEAVIGAAEAIAVGTERVQGRGGGGGVLTDLWPWVIGACLLLLAAEWWVYHRRHWL